MSFAQTSDLYTWSDSNTHIAPHPVFTSKQWAYQTDQNPGSYSSRQLVFDLAGFYNSSRWLNVAEMYMVLPVNIVLSASAGGTVADAAIGSGLGCPPSQQTAADTATTVVNRSDNGGAITDQFAFGWKSGYWHLINSIQISVDGKDLIQMTPNINYYASFVANTTWSDGDVAKWGAILGFYPDSCDSWILNRTQAVNDMGIGVCNNDPWICQQPYCDAPFLANNITASNADADLAFCNTKNPNYPSQYGSQSLGNRGFLQRMKWTNYYNPILHEPDQLQINYGRNGHRNPQFAPASNEDLQNRLMSEILTFRNAASTILKTSTTDANALSVDSRGDSSFRQLHTYCVIRFRDICDLFSKLPISRGLYIRATINLNTGTQVIRTSALLDTLVSAQASSTATYVSASGAYTTTLPSLQQFTANFQGFTCPIMIASLKSSALSGTTIAMAAGVTNPKYPIDANIPIYPGVACDAGTITRKVLNLSVALVKADTSVHTQLLSDAKAQLKDTGMGQCRIYAPVIDLAPALESDYNSKIEHQIYYKDVIAFVFKAEPNAQFTHQLANGLVNAKRLIMIPFYHDDTTGAAPPADTGTTQLRLQGTAPICPYGPTSPYDSAPGTTAPMATLVDFQVLVSNMNCFQRGLTYGFDTFLQEVQGVNSINGGLFMGLQSGQVDYYKWTNNYRYYVVDISRRLAGDNTPKSITIQGRSTAALNIDFHVYVEYERHLTLDVMTGHVIASSN